MPLVVLPNISERPETSDFKPSLYTFDSELLLESLAAQMDGSGYYARVTGKGDKYDLEILKLDMGASLKYSVLSYSSPKAGPAGETVAEAVAQGSETKSGGLARSGNQITLKGKDGQGDVVLEVVDKGHLKEWKSGEGARWTEFYFYLGTEGSGALESCGSLKWFERELPGGGTTGLLLRHAHLFSIQ